MDLMMENLPVTLVVKAPNQRIEDQTVECMLNWTVKKLKEHLSIVYPNKPSEIHQKIIYSGKLLTDNLTLGEVLRQPESRHTVHLVCHPLSNDSNTQSDHQPDTTPESHPSLSQSPQDTDGLRHRGHSDSSTAQQYEQYYYSNNPAFYSQYNPSAMTPPQGLMSPPAGMVPPGMMSPPAGMMPPGMAYTPEQYMWMQQMYAQYMAQYMQYYENGQASTEMQPVTEAVPEQDAAANRVAENNQPNARPANQNMRMNAQGGAVLDDEDEGQRDLLDWVYVLCRAVVLLSIIYFYSTFGRFILVMVFFFFVYLYQTGWVPFRQRNPPQNAPVANEPQDAAGDQPPPENTDSGETNTSDAETDAQDGDTATDVLSDEPIEPPPPGTVATICSFVMTFFSSLLPTPPPAVNAN